MYKARFAKWGDLNKYNRAADMTVLVGKKRQRDAQGKKTTFMVRGRDISFEEVDRYFRRRKTQDSDVKKFCTDMPTPTYVQSVSQPPSPTPIDAQVFLIKSDEDNAEPCYANAFFTRKRKRSKSSPGHHQSHRSLRPRELSPSAPYNPRAPDIFLKHEVSFANMASYVAASIENGVWVIDKSGWLKSTEKNSKVSDDFFPLCRRAADAFTRLQFVRGRMFMSRAFSTLLMMHREEHPRALWPLLDVFIYWGLRGFVGLCAILQDYLRRMANAILPERTAWRQICISLSLLDPDHVEVMTRMYRCLVDSLRRYTGRFSPPSVKCETSLQLRMYRTTAPGRAEPPLRQLLSDYEQRTVSIDSTALYIRASLASCLFYQKKYSEAEALIEETQLAAQHSRFVLKNPDPAMIEIFARLQYEQHKNGAAENHMRMAIASWAEKFGPEDSGILNCCVRLERWLREGGREEEAEELKAKIAEMIGPDDIDLDLGSVNL